MKNQGPMRPLLRNRKLQKLYAYGARLLEKGMPMDLAMDRFFAGLEADDFYIRTHDSEEEEVSYRVRMVLRERPAPSPNRREQVKSSPMGEFTDCH